MIPPYAAYWTIRMSNFFTESCLDGFRIYGLEYFSVESLVDVLSTIHHSKCVSCFYGLVHDEVYVRDPTRIITTIGSMFDNLASMSYIHKIIPLSTHGNDISVNQCQT
jgi:predicted metallopeptidase